MYSIMSDNVWKLFLRSSLEELQKIPPFIDAIPALKRLKEDKLYFLKLSLHELAVNAIIHGNMSEIEKKIEISLDINREKILISITDEGKGFSKEWYEQRISVPSSTIEGGRGLRLISETMDLVSLHVTNNQFTATFEMNA